MADSQLNKFTVLQTGTYCSFNKGDAAMQLVCADKLPTAISGIECVIGAPFPSIDEPFYAPRRCVRSRRRNLLLGTLWLFIILLRRFLRRPVRDRFSWDAEIDEMARASAVIDLSGDMLTEDYGPHVGYSHFLPLLQGLALGKPVMVLAQSIGPFRWLTPLARFVLRRASLVTVREDISLGLVSSMGVDDRKLERTADLAFLLPAVGQSRVDEIMVEEGIKDAASPPWLGVSVSALLLHHRRRRWSGNKVAPMDVLASVLDRVSERHGLIPILISHVTGPRPIADDRRVARMLRERMRAPSLILQGDYRPDELKGIIKRCYVFMGFRMHANIAALDSGVPTLAIGYSHKTLGIMGLLGFEDFVLSFSELEVKRLEERLEFMIERRGGISAQLHEALPEIRSAAAKNLLLVGQLLSRPQELGSRIR